MMKLKNLVLNTDQVANAILKNWNHDENSLNFWRGSANYVYFFTLKGDRYWLRFSRKDENSLEQIKAEIEFLLYLKENNFSAVYPIISNNHRYIEVVEDEGETYYAVVFNKAEGVNLEIEDMTEAEFECWGKSLASLHRLSKTFRPKEHVRNSWKQVLEVTSDILSDFPNEQNAKDELKKVEKWLKSLPVTNENYGLIHYDFELDNVFFNKQSRLFKAIDFDSSMYHWYVMDIACTLGDLNELDSPKAEDGLKHFLKGYRSINGIEEEFIDLLPKFERFDNLISFAKLLRSLQDSSFPSEPEWLKRLRPRLLKKCDEYRKGFEKAW
ncbi:phosphotransferase enzyme family protein [Clostridiales bacterium oral taxon 876 str. F0540]|nr:phosphotransferase enzyme family protein [Clostridiales bacterium oral taxon 876 str. F0540]